MASRDYRDLLAGLVMVGLGGAIAGYAVNRYAIGSLGHIGPGLLPAVAGTGMALLGLMIAIPALFRPWSSFGDIDLRALGAVTASGLAFAWLAPRFGMMPAVAGLVLVASLASRRVTPVFALAMAAGLCGVSYIIFHLGLGVAMPPFRLSL